MKLNFARFSLTAFILAIATIVFGQTNPSPQALPYSQTFSTFNGTTSTYPAGWQGWFITGSLSGTVTPYKPLTVAVPTGDQPMTANGGTNATTTSGIYDMNGKITVVSTASAMKTLCLALNTTGVTGAVVSYTVATQAQVLNGRIDRFGAQYRVGTSGVFNGEIFNGVGTDSSIKGSSYLNDATVANTSGTGSVNPKTIRFTLPSSCDNKPIVQLRWLLQDSGGGGNRPAFSITNVQVCAATNITALTPTNGNTQVQLNWTNPGCYDSIMVVATSNGSIISAPSGSTVYTANSVFATSGTGANLSASEYAVYKDVGNSVIVTGLTNGVTYQFKVFTKRGNTWSTGVTTSGTPVAPTCTIPTDFATFLGTDGNAQSVLSWTFPGSPCYDQIIIVGKATTVVTSTPTGNGSNYVASASFGGGTSNTGLNASEYCVYNSTGNGTTTTVSNLTNGTTYNFTAFARRNSTWSTGISVTVNPILPVYYWNGGTPLANPAAGGTGTWGTAGVWRSPRNNSATPATWTDGFNAVFAGTAGTVSIDNTRSATQYAVNTDGYIFANGATTYALSGPMVLGNNVGLTFAPNIGATAANGTITVGSISGTGTANVTIQTSETAAGANATHLNLATASSSISVPVNINAIPVTTDFTIGTVASNGGNFDLNGHNQTLGSLASGLGGGTVTNSAASATGTLTLNGSSATTFAYNINDGATAKVALTRAGTGTTVIGGTNTYTGATTITGGTLVVDGSIVAAGSVVLSSGGTLGGKGTVNPAVSPASGSTLSPGGSTTGSTTANLTTGALTLTDNVTYSWDVNNASGAEGTASGWDKITSTGAITINVTTTPIKIKINGLTVSNVAGIVPNFSNGSLVTYTIMQGSSISGFSANKFTLDVTNFSNNNPLNSGVWSIVQNANMIQLVFTPAAYLPTVSFTNTMTPFSAYYGTASAPKTFQVAGTFLTGDITVKAPSNYELRVGTTGSYSDSVTLTQSGGNVTTTSLQIRQKGIGLPTTANGVITGSTPGAADKTTPVTGEVLPHIAINELHWNPDDALGYVDASYEFIELYNTEAFPVNLQNYSFFGVTYTFPSLVIPAGGYVVVAVDSTKYPGIGCRQWFSGGLNNNGEPIELLSPSNNIVDSVYYLPTAPWPTAANGFGPSIELINTSLNHADPTNWQSSLYVNGTPGLPNSTPVTTLYAVASGNANLDGVWSHTPTGSPQAIIYYGGFSSTKDVVIKSGNQVYFQSTADIKNLTVESGARIYRNSNNTANMVYLNIYGSTILNSGNIGNGSSFDALGFNLEAATVSISGSGSGNLGRMRKTFNTNVTTNVNIQQNFDLWYPGTAIYNNAPAGATINFNIPYPYVMTFHNGADLSMDGTDGTSAANLGGVITVGGSLLGVDTLYARTNNTSLSTPVGLVLNSTASFSANSIICDGVDSAAYTNGHFQFDVVNGADVTIYKNLDLKSGIVYIPSNSTCTFKSASSTQFAYINNFSPGFAGTLVGQVKAERFVPISGAAQHFISSPLNNLPLTQLGVSLTGTNGVAVTPNGFCSEDSLHYNSNYGNVFELNEALVPVGGGACFQKAWVVRSSGTMTNTRGYSVNMTGNSTYTMTGTPNLGTTYPISNLGNSNWSSTSYEGHTYRSGWHLVGNPFMSNVSLDNIHPGIDAQIQVWQTSGAFSGTFQALVQGTNALIAPFQAFMIHNPTTGSSATFSVDRTEQVIGNTNFYKTNGNDHEMNITVSGNGFSDITYINFNSMSTDTFDSEFDADKIHSSHGHPTIYSQIGSRWGSINTLPAVEQVSSIPVGFESDADGQYSLTFGGIETFDANTTVVLEDKKLGVFTPVTVNSTYSFAALKSDNRERFELHFSYKTTGITTIDHTETRVFTSHDKLIVDFGKSNVVSADIALYNILGQQQFADHFNGSGSYVHSLNDLSTGYGIVTVKTTDGNTVTQKVFIGNK